MTKLKDLEKRLEKMEKRNREKDADKSWETSFTRRAILVLLTYREAN